MIVGEFIQVVRHVAELAGHAKNEALATELKRLADSLVPYSDQVINAKSRSEIRASFGNEDLKMRFGNAFGFLRVFQKSASDIGRAKDVKALQGMVTALEKAPAKPPAPRPMAKPSPDAERLLRELNSIGLDRPAFESFIKRLADASLDLKDYNYLAAEFGRTQGKHRTKDAALTALRDRFDSLKQRDRKGKDIDKLTRRKPAHG